MEIKERIGDYVVIKSGEIAIFNNTPIEINISDSNTICIRIEFEYGNEKFSIQEYLNKTTHKLKFSNMCINSICGTFEPIDIAKLDSGEILYIIANVIMFDDKKGNGLLKYSLLTK